MSLFLVKNIDNKILFQKILFKKWNLLKIDYGLELQTIPKDVVQ